MNPFSELIRSLRVQRGLRQADLAALVGCHRKTITAVENGEGVGARVDLIGRLGMALGLREEEQFELAHAAERSQRTYTIPDEAPTKAYELVWELFGQLDQMSEREIDALRVVLSIRTDRRPALSATTRRVVRKDKVWKSDAVP